MGSVMYLLEKKEWVKKALWNDVLKPKIEKSIKFLTDAKIKLKNIDIMSYNKDSIEQEILPLINSIGTYARLFYRSTTISELLGCKNELIKIEILNDNGIKTMETITLSNLIKESDDLIKSLHITMLNIRGSIKELYNHHKIDYTEFKYIKFYMDPTIETLSDAKSFYRDIRDIPLKEIMKK